ncbi:Holliday junction DNA helicase RuvB [Candidatus Adlerbacteria bacterium RIFCSPHIGHO2_01_FULL_54_23]|uniref:Holliday junction branch migration complex subunit RuvB n=2 Tax=Candidatus Adleribacteriota TaxID=1752736 RepID=A0A1F4XZ66_9BACT|nr:MAG: Holliday junction ATP-dependent DNA helicase RuvB [Candidatus Adlerbacteria bacterium GW2011_GWA2_54_12]KKW37798.1 MAG: Holliday junction ATP-dependent DNA helicase RuvB [Candidatus Adlerbacteria bacterium GW2011_GWB1_54_7]OGC78813.1 MAG: Holliday junction DNA helicase RuvB [Candidatus Adlerbacteria bacterium RIFCSPHIGHO2_01_FULL_54_23]OGC86888.1 MAG: Holliday junction DNA helicase RuvB [Candidatus Adlerbacteria bacterium RIFCSPLOWO2_01_FULL_54_16]
MSNTANKDQTSEVFLDQTLRPAQWEEYVGQEPIKNNLHILISAAKERGAPPEHVLFYGPPGLGKTTLAHLIARELGGAMRATSGPAVERVGDLAALLTNLGQGDVLFIDEIHRLPRAIEEVLYPAMESGVLNIIIGKGPSARTIELPLPPFTLVAATTRVADLSAPLRSRFSGGSFRLEFYSEDEIARIIKRSAKILEVKIDADGITEIARRSRATPRTANYLLKRARDYAQLKRSPLSGKTVGEALFMLEVDVLGLTPLDRKLLAALIERFQGGPAGVNALAAALAEEPATISEVHEPFLLQLGLIERTPRGRVATAAAYKHLGKEPPADLNQRLL